MRKFWFVMALIAVFAVTALMVGCAKKEPPPTPVGPMGGGKMTGPKAPPETPKATDEKKTEETVEPAKGETKEGVEGAKTEEGKAGAPEAKGTETKKAGTAEPTKGAPEVKKGGPPPAKKAP